MAEFLMGHSEGIRNLSAVYSGLRDLDPKSIETLKEKYQQILPDLEFGTNETQVSLEVETLRRVMGLDPDLWDEFMRWSLYR